jgi:hypothetical protein
MPSQGLYRQLRKEDDEIRLIEVSLCSSGTNVQCELVTVSLHNNPEFTALSYVWGDPTVTEQILLDGNLFPVTVNLATALRYVKEQWHNEFPDRNPKSFRLWADAISINQEDTDEKSSQVPLMQAIYSKSDLVIAWFGCGSKDVDSAFHTLNLISDETKSVRGSLSQEPPHDILWMKKYPHLCEKDSTETTVENKAWEALHNFSQNSYWKRVWIFQELVLGQNIVLAHGSKSLKYSDLIAACSWIQTIRAQVLTGMEDKPDFIDNMIWLSLAYNLYSSSRYDQIETAKFIVKGKFEEFEASIVERNHLGTNPSTMSSLEFLKSSPSGARPHFIRLSSLFLASDPRDHIYGLLGLTKLTIIPDYRKTIEEVYCDFVSAVMDDLQSTHWLCEAGIGIFPPQLESIAPSWMPNHSRISRTELGQRTRFTNFFHYSALDDCHDLPVLLGRRLVASGLTCSVASIIHEAFTLETRSTGLFFSFVCDFVSRRPSYVTGIHPLNAIFQVLQNEYIDLSSNKLISIRARAFLYLATDHLPDSVQEQDIHGLLGMKLDESFWAFFIRVFVPDSDPVDIYESLLDPVPDSEFLVIARYIRELEENYRFFETESGCLGLAPRGTLRGDLICIIKGCGVPLALRKVEDHYVIIGSCFVLGLMESGLLELLKEEKARFGKI